MVGQWPHAKPADPETYAASLAAVLAQYPLGLVQECVDPRTGLARTREFPPTVAAVVEWCDWRLEWHQSVAAYVPKPRLEVVDLPDDPNMAQRAQTLLVSVIAHFRANPEGPLDRALREQANARRLRVEEVMRRAYQAPAERKEEENNACTG